MGMYYFSIKHVNNRTMPPIIVHTMFVYYMTINTFSLVQR